MKNSYQKENQTKSLIFDGISFQKLEILVFDLFSQGHLDSSHTDKEWLEMVSNNFDVVEYNKETRKAYNFEKQPSNLLEILLKMSIKF